MTSWGSNAGDRSHVERTRALVAFGVLLLGGCGGGHVSNPFEEGNRREAVVLEVDNRHWADMTVSVRRGGNEVRLGMVTTNGRGRFEIPPEASAPGMSVTFVADPVGSRDTYESPSVVLQAGETYLWTLAVALEQSSLVRR